MYFNSSIGDNPPRDRTSELRVLGFPTRHLGPVQMTTDTALGVTKLVVDDGIVLDKIPYVVSWRPTENHPANGHATRTSQPSVSIPRNPSKCRLVSLILHTRLSETLTRTIGYIADGTEPRLPPGMKILLHEDLNKPFDF